MYVFKTVTEQSTISLKTTGISERAKHC